TNSTTYGIEAENNAPGTISSSSVFRNNLIFNNHADWYYGNDGVDSTITSAFIVTGTVSGKDPQFVSSSSGNYHLSAGSPPVGAGLQTSYVPTVDLSGTLRSNPPAIGPYEP